MSNLTKTTIDNLRGINGWVNKADESIELDIENLTTDGLRYLVEYGFKQSLNDAVASVKKGDTKDAADLAHKRATAILRGQVGQGGGGSSPLKKAIRAVLSERIDGWSDFSAKAKNDTISKIQAGGGNESAQAILAEAERRVEAQTKTEVTDLGI